MRKIIGTRSKFMDESKGNSILSIITTYVIGSMIYSDIAYYFFFQLINCGQIIIEYKAELID